jgi:beta-adrenergic-receptor kinase
MMKLGQGALGIVEGAKRLETGKCFALKRQDKRLIKKKGATRMCIAERDVLAEVQSRFVVRVHYAFQNRSYIFLALDLMTGGTLEYNVQQQDDGKFSEAASAFYGAEVACGLRALHCKDVIYRDLKSENVLLNDKGHAMLSDMGIATKKRPGKPMNQKIGTPGWWAPEVCKGETYGRRSDWFSFGCLMYEMLVGHNPFLRKAHQSNKHPDAMTVEWDPMGADGGWEDLGLSDDAVGLLKGLLQKNPANRLHYDKIRDHPFFAHIEWDLMETGDWDEPPPIIPNAGEACVDQEENIMQRQSVGRLSFVQLSSNEFDKFDFHNKATVQEELVTLHMSGLQIRPEGSQVAKSSACNVQ